jgi:transposase
VSAITAQCCPPSQRNGVRDRAEYAAAHAKGNDAVKAAVTLRGIGPVTASADGGHRWVTSSTSRTAPSSALGSGCDAQQRSSGGKSSLGGITKRGDIDLRTLLIQDPGGEVGGEAVMTAHRRQDKLSQWVVALRERSGWQ